MERRRVSITFDNGPTPGITDRVLDILAERRVPATFFVVGQRLEAPESLCEYVLGLSHAIITPEGRSNVGFDAPLDVPAGASALDRLLAYTGRAR